MGAAWGSPLSPASQSGVRALGFLLPFHLLYIPPGKRRCQPFKKMCPSPPAMPTMAYFLGTTAHLGPFLGLVKGASASGAHAATASLLLTFPHALELLPGSHRSSRSTSLRISPVEPWHADPAAEASVVETAPECSSQSHHQWPKLSRVTSGWAWHATMSPSAGGQGAGGEVAVLL